MRNKGLITSIKEMLLKKKLPPELIKEPSSIPRNLTPANFLCEKVVFKQIKRTMTSQGQIHNGGLNLLSRIYAIKVKEFSYAEVTIFAKSKNQANIKYTINESKMRKKLIIPILYLYQDYQNRIEILIKNSTRTIIKEIFLNIFVDRLYQENPEIIKEPIVGNYQDIKNYLFFTSSSTGEPKIAYDKYGEIRWYLPQKTYLIPENIKNGIINLPIDFKKFKATSINLNSKNTININFIGLAASKSSDVSCFGATHDNIKLRNCKQVLISNPYNFESKNLPPQDHLLVFNRQQKLIDIKDMKAIWRKLIKKEELIHKIFAFPNDDWLHLNALWPVKRNKILISSRNLSLIYQFNLKTNKIEWFTVNSKAFENILNFEYLKTNNIKIISIKNQDAFWGQYAVKLISAKKQKISFSILDNQYPFDTIGKWDNIADTAKNAFFKKFTINLKNTTYTLDQQLSVDKITYMGQAQYFAKEKLAYTYISDSGNIQITSCDNHQVVFKKYFGAEHYRITSYEFISNFNC